MYTFLYIKIFIISYLITIAMQFCLIVKSAFLPPFLNPPPFSLIYYLKNHKRGTEL